MVLVNVGNKFQLRRKAMTREAFEEIMMCNHHIQLDCPVCEYVCVGEDDEQETCHVCGKPLGEGKITLFEFVSMILNKIDPK